MSNVNVKFKHILLTGFPGIGKTTLIRKICNALKEQNIPVVGFYTEEILDKYKKRIGFDVVSLNGQRSRLSRTSDILQPHERSSFRVGKYLVLVKEFESVALHLFSNLSNNAVLVIDEVGKMELFSEAFTRKVSELFSNPSLTILATVPVRGRDQPLLKRLTTDPQNHMFNVTMGNRDKLLEEILNVFDV